MCPYCPQLIDIDYHNDLAHGGAKPLSPWSLAVSYSDISQLQSAQCECHFL